MLFKQSHTLRVLTGELSAANITFLKKTFPGKVVSVEGDGEMSLSTSSEPVLLSDGQTVAGPYPGLQLVSPIGTPWVQTTADWALRRVNARHLPLPESYTFDTLGTGVNAYLIDTGIRFSHDDFLPFPGAAAAAGVSRAAAAVSVFGDDDASDCNGHGTQTASLLGGLAFGVAKNVSLWAVRAVDCDGTTSFSSILQGLEWVAEHHRKPAVVNLSVRSTTDNVALSRALSALSRTHGIPTVVAAGNDGADACSSLPSNASGVLAVGATTPDDARWEGSNWGPCVALYAPGANVVGAGSLSDTDVVVRNGTSLSAPLVAGVLAQLLERQPVREGWRGGGRLGIEFYFL